MDKFEMQRKIFRINALLLLVAVISLIVTIPAILKDTSPYSLPKQAAIATAVGTGVHLLIFTGFLIGSRLAKRQRRINKEINLAAAIVLFILGIMILDGATSFMDDVILASTGMFICFFCDLAATIVSVVALFLLRTKKKNQPRLT